MNIAFFLTPKNEVICENQDATMKQVMEKMECYGYTAIPIIDREGKICWNANRRRFIVEAKKHT